MTKTGRSKETKLDGLKGSQLTVQMTESGQSTRLILNGPKSLKTFAQPSTLDLFHLFTFAPDKRQPRIKLAWFNSSERMRHPGPTIDGIFIEFVANPIPNVKVSSTPRNLLHLIKITLTKFVFRQ